MERIGEKLKSFLLGKEMTFNESKNQVFYNEESIKNIVIECFGKVIVEPNSSDEVIVALGGKIRTKGKICWDSYVNGGTICIKLEPVGNVIINNLIYIRVMVPEKNFEILKVVSSGDIIVRSKNFEYMELKSDSGHVTVCQ